MRTAAVRQVVIVGLLGILVSACAFNDSLTVYEAATDEPPTPLRGLQETQQEKLLSPAGKQARINQLGQAAQGNEAEGGAVSSSGATIAEIQSLAQKQKEQLQAP
ncbi:hypothetical protein [Polycladidibacter hongkongensis]|uniref:hypothetical protein n=1 Tax=Polycladidibacter hongkongensis TaxID=1647556 RepID=UPI0008322B5E|nr:hypothetical protein [Pseudovibrio hongkongensis]